MSGSPLNLARLQGALSAGGQVSVRVGLVTNYDPTRYTAKVALQPNGQLTNWLQVASLWVGNGWGLYSPPSVNEMVVVLLVEGKQSAGVVLGRLFNTQDVPTAVQSGELWLLHTQGQSIKLTNDGAITLSDGQGAQIQLPGDGSIKSMGPWTHTGNFTATQIVTGQSDVQAGAEPVSLVNHTHTGVTSGSGNTGPPA